MKKNYIAMVLIAILVFAIDQAIKSIFLGGFEWQSKCISLELHFNTGVAFSMFSFLGNWLKWIQLALIGAIIIFILKEQYMQRNFVASGILIGAAFGNLFDRFAYGGVVDYVAWHCGFNFAVFNFADVMIDIAVGLFLLNELWLKKRAK